MFADSRFITIHGLTLHFRVVMPEGKVRHRVLLVPSPGQSTASWRFIVPELTAAGCQCVLCDLPGFGLSECRDDAPQDQDTRARFLWGLLDALDLEEGASLNCWHLMAHGSACGAIAQMALLQPDSVSSLFMLCPILYPPVPAPLIRLAARPAALKYIRGWFKRNILRRRKFASLASRMYAGRLSERMLGQLHRPLLRLNGHELMLQRLITDSFHLDLSTLNDLFMPSMVIWGGRDPLLGGKIPDKLRLQHFKSAEYHLLPSAGHYPAETNSRAIRDFLRGWIRELWGG